MGQSVELIEDDPMAGLDALDALDDAITDGDALAEDAIEETPEFFDVPDATFVQVVNEGRRVSWDARQERREKNRRHWDAVHSKFPFVALKRKGQSKIVLPSLQMSLEQVCGTLSSQLVGLSNWFTMQWDGDDPLEGLDGERSAGMLKRELDRLYQPGDAMPTTYGMRELVYDSVFMGLVESEIVWKVTAKESERLVYQLGRNGDTTGDDEPYRGTSGPAITTVPVKEWRLNVELVPFEDFFPDPSPARNFDIHEVEVGIDELPEFGFDDDTIAAIRGQVSTEKQEDRRNRSGQAQPVESSKNRVVLREFWGNIIDPNTGEMLARNAYGIVCGSVVCRRPQPNPLWHARRPFIRVPILKTPKSHAHRAYLDIAVPLVEAESELTNLVIDGGFEAVHGIKEVREYMLEDPTQMANGLVPGIELTVAEGHGDAPVVRRVDTGKIPPDTINVLDRIGRIRQEAFAINDLQLGRLPPRKESATAIVESSEASNDLFSEIALRVEGGGIEPLVELCWLTMLQFYDWTPEDLMARGLSAPLAQVLGMLTEAERFALLANGVSFKVEGYRAQLGAIKKFQQLLTLQNGIASNPALLAAFQQEFSPTKMFRLMYRALGVDATELRRDPDEPYIDPRLLSGQAGNPAANPGGASADETADPPNPTGERGAQLI